MRIKAMIRRCPALLYVLLFVTALNLPSCSSQKAEELYKTAQFEELQTNWEHAGQIYERIIADHPNSEYADKSKARLSELAAEGKYPIKEYLYGRQGRQVAKLWR